MIKYAMGNLSKEFHQLEQARGRIYLTYLRKTRKPAWLEQLECARKVGNEVRKGARGKVMSGPEGMEKTLLFMLKDRENTLH